MDKKYLLVLVFLLFSSIALAEESFVYKAGEIDLKIYCLETNLSICNSGVTCQITTLYPNSTIFIDNQTMTRTSVYYNYTFVTQTIGEYAAFVSCDGATDGFTTYNFLVTTTGIDDLSIPIFLIVISFVMFLMTMIFRNEYIGFFAGAMFLVTGVYTMIYGFGNIADIYTRAIAFVSLGFGILLVISSSFKAMEESE